MRSRFIEAPMTITVTNEQRACSVRASRILALARRAARRLRIRSSGTMAVTFIGARRMRALNKRFLRHDRLTDVLSFRYDGEPIVGEILIAPAQARAYAKRHGFSYEEELSRYVVHGLLHWMGHDDRTSAQQRTMRKLEDRLLTRSDDRRNHQSPNPKHQISSNHQARITKRFGHSFYLLPYDNAAVAGG